MIKQTIMYGLSVWVSTSVDNVNKIPYCYVYRSCVWKSVMQKHSSFGWKYEKCPSSMPGERCCTIAICKVIGDIKVVHDF